MLKSYPVLVGTLTTVFVGPLFARQPPPPPGKGGANGGGQNLQALCGVPEPDENPITEQKRVLGKILFWDEQLSSDNTVAGGADIPIAAPIFSKSPPTLR
jgi:hypothetical protein